MSSKLRAAILQSLHCCQLKGLFALNFFQHFGAAEALQGLQLDLPVEIFFQGEFFRFAVGQFLGSVVVTAAVLEPVPEGRRSSWSRMRLSAALRLKQFGHRCGRCQYLHAPESVEFIQGHYPFGRLAFLLSDAILEGGPTPAIAPRYRGPAR